jgi:transposase
MTEISQHVSLKELERRYEMASDPVAKSHFHALYLLSLGYEHEEVAEILSFSPRWVFKLIARYNAQGPDGLGDRRCGNGAAPKLLTPAALGALKQRLKTPPDDGGLWSGPKVARWLARFHGLASVHDQRGWDALLALGWTIQQPRPRHPEAASEEDRARLKKNSSRPPPRSAANIPARGWRFGRATSIASA